MDLRAFRRLLAAYGGDLSRWPKGKRRAARALAEASPELRQLLDEAARLDGALAALQEGPTLSETRLAELVGRAADRVADQLRAARKAKR